MSCFTAITKEYFIDHYNKHGPLAGYGPDVLGWFYTIVDRDGNGIIDLDEFIRFEHCSRSISTRDPNWKLKLVFKILDKDNSGTIDLEEMTFFFKANGNNASIERIKEYMKRIDADGNGVIDMDEFINFYVASF